MRILSVQSKIFITSLSGHCPFYHTMSSSSLEIKLVCLFSISSNILFNFGFFLVLISKRGVCIKQYKKNINKVAGIIIVMHMFVYCF